MEVDPVETLVVGSDDEDEAEENVIEMSNVGDDVVVDDDDINVGAERAFLDSEGDETSETESEYYEIASADYDYDSEDTETAEDENWSVCRSAAEKRQETERLRDLSNNGWFLGAVVMEYI